MRCRVVDVEKEEWGQVRRGVACRASYAVEQEEASQLVASPVETTANRRHCEILAERIACVCSSLLV
jgi:hypothetical protein